MGLLVEEAKVQKEIASGKIRKMRDREII